jgi:hypothetical protein
VLDVAIPPRPATFTPAGAPPGVDVRLDVFGPWPSTRPTIRPRVTIVHTNGASVEATVQSSINYGNAAPSNTKPHYHVGDRPAKVLATNRWAIANATGDDLQAATGEVDCALWSIAIETADMGSRAATAAGIAWPDDCGPFLARPGAQPDDDEIVARILAYESIVWDIPLQAPAVWNGTGVAAHTVPFPFPHYTIARGKTCPGRTKSRQLFDEILARAQTIRAAWLGATQPLPPPVVPPTITPPPMEVSNVFTYSPAGYANAFLIGAGPAIHLDGPSFAQCQALKVPHVRATEPHAQMLRSILHQSGLTEADLVKIP